MRKQYNYIFTSFFFCLFVLYSTSVYALTFNFKDADLRDVIEGYALMVGKSFIIDSRVTGKVNVISSEEISIDQAEDMMHSILQVHGYVMQEIAGKVKILPDQLMREGSIYSEDSSILPSDKIITQLFTLENIPVNDFVSAIRPIIPKESSLIPYIQNNTLIVTSNAFSIEKIKQIITKIDEPNLTETEIIKIENLNAIDMAKVLDRFFSNQKEQIGLKLTAPIFMVDKNTNSIIVKSHASDMSQIRILIGNIEEKNELTDETQVIYLKHAQAEYLAETLKALTIQEGTEETSFIQIQPDSKLNALVIRADLGTQKMLKKVINQLDIPRRQVLVEAVVADISDNDALALGLSTITGSLGDVQTSVQLGATNLMQLAADTITDMTAVINLLASNTTSDILSTPSIITIDNEEAEIIVGRNVPFLTGSFNDTNNSAFQTLERQDVGVTLRIKPQISEGDTIRLDILQEVSSIDATITSSNDTVTSKKSIKTNVMVNNEEMIVIGGLIDEKLTDSEFKIPVLGSIPLLGGLFRNTSQVMEKRNLVIFIKTSIIDYRGNNDGLQKLTDSKYSQIEELLGDKDRPKFTIVPKLYEPHLQEHIKK